MMSRSSGSRSPSARARRGSSSGSEGPSPLATGRGGREEEGSQVEPLVGELVELAEVETVVRLDSPGSPLRDLVLTGDVVESLHHVLRAAASVASGGSGAAFFVVGPFGSGKSHFLAALGELLSDPTQASTARWADEEQEILGGLASMLAVPVPLVEYRAKAALEDVVALRARRALAEAGRPGEATESGEATEAGDAGDSSAGDQGVDRMAVWDGFLEDAAASGRKGLVILIDELSEFLRAKRGNDLTEDLRFLQFLGEWAARRPVVVLGALQESIDEVANVSQRELARIRDRYPVSLSLSMRHVEDLVRGRIVKLSDGALSWIERLHESLKRANAAPGLTVDRLIQSYPLHPDTLQVLEGLRFLLSQQRGVVAFVHAALADHLGRPWYELVTPERIYDHFSDRLRERHETSSIAESVVPYYERAAAELFDPEDEDLAIRTVKLLALLAASPIERPRSAAELAAMLLVRVSDVDPAANVAYLEHAVLDRLVAHGAYVVADEGSVTTYRLEALADAALLARRRVEQAIAETNPDDRRVLATLAEIGSSPQMPLGLLAELGPTLREVMWQNTLRPVLVTVSRLSEMSDSDVEALLGRVRASGAEGCVAVAEVEMAGHEEALRRARDIVGRSDFVAVWVPSRLQPDELAAAVEMHATRQVRLLAEREGATEQADLLSKSADQDAARAREIIRRAYFGGEVLYPAPRARAVVSSGASRAGPRNTAASTQQRLLEAPEEVPAEEARRVHAGAHTGSLDLPSLAGMAFERHLPIVADGLLSARHPGHRQVAPRGELVGDRLLRQLVSEVLPAGRLSAAALSRDRLRPLVEGYLVPLGLARVRADGAVMAPDPRRSPAVAELLRIVGDGDPVEARLVIHELAAGWLGLTEPESLLLLNACMQSGLVEMWRGRRRLEEPFMAVTSSDRVGAGILVDPSVRDAISRLGPMVGPGPFDPWSAAIQRDAWNYAKAWLEARREAVAQVRSGLERATEIPLLSAAGTEQTGADADAVEQLAASVLEAPSAPEGLGALARLVDDPAALLSRARRIESLARFFRDDLRRVEEAASYLTHPDLLLPPEDPRLGELLERALSAIAGAVDLACEERTPELFAAVREVREAYAAAYQQEHDAYYGAVSHERLAEVRASDAYRVLARFASVRALAVPDDLSRLERTLAEMAPRPCTRRLELELAWKPRCSCGFSVGTAPPVLDPAALVAKAAQGVGEYMAELAREEHAERLERAATDLESIGREEVAGGIRRLAGLARRATEDHELDGETLVELAGGLLSDELLAVISDVLAGGQLVVERDLRVLADDLVGRRYTKRRLLELVAAWADPDGTMPPTGFVEVLDSRGPTAAGSGASGTVEFLQARYPSIARLLPEQAPAEAFWLSAWYTSATSYLDPLRRVAAGALGGTPGAFEMPRWVPASMLGEGELLEQAALSALEDPAARRELENLDAKVAEGTLMGEQVVETLRSAGWSFETALRVLESERLLRLPLRVAANEVVRRLAGAWHLASRAYGLDTDEISARHALVGPGELSALELAIEAAHRMQEVERRIGLVDARGLVEELYALLAAEVPELLSRSELAALRTGLVEPAALEDLARASKRLLTGLNESFGAHLDAGAPGCLQLFQVGTELLRPLLERHGRVGVLLVDAMRVDLGRHLLEVLPRYLPGREATWRVAVVSGPTRTAESMASLARGEPVAAGAVRPVAGGEEMHSRSAGAEIPPFAHLGYEVRVLKHADREESRVALEALWRDGPPVSLAVASAVDERLHRTSAEVAALIDDAMAGLERRILPSLAALPPSVPLVVLADHGFKESDAWGQGPEGRYVHGGPSLEESVVPVIVASPLA